MSTTTSSFDDQMIDMFHARNILQDRLPGDLVVLPHTFYDIKIKVNDYVLAETINYSIEKLYDNWLYMLAYSVIPSNNIPDQSHSPRMICDVGAGPEWKNQSTFPVISGNTTGRSLDNINNIIKIKNIANTSNYNYIATTNTNVILLSGNDNNIDVIVNPDTGHRSDNSITHPSNGINFMSISDIVVSDSNILFVLDNTLKSIFKFDISGILTLDEAILKNDTPGRLMTGIIGGLGEITDKTKFKDNISATTYNNLLYIIDHDQSIPNTAIKVYDSQLNWIKTSILGSDIPSTPKDISYNPTTDRFYILCHSGTSYHPGYIVTLDSGLNYISKDPLHDVLKHSSTISDENHRKIYFSKENPNIFYLVTDKNIYKKYLSRPTSFIGKFLLTEKNIISADRTPDIQDIHISLNTTQDSEDQNINKDEIILYNKSSNIIYQFLEDSNFQRSVNRTMDSKIIKVEDINIKHEEYVNTLVYNKMILKLLYNNTILLENMMRRFSTKYDELGFSRYVGFNYFIESEIKKTTYNITDNTYIGVNELVLTTTINRCLEQVYNIQLSIQELLQEKSINVYPLTTQVIDLNT
jgi:hypothetical protein